jgi:hypothetical protein
MVSLWVAGAWLSMKPVQWKPAPLAAEVVDMAAVVAEATVVVVADMALGAVAAVAMAAAVVKVVVTVVAAAVVRVVATVVVATVVVAAAVKVVVTVVAVVKVAAAMMVASAARTDRARVAAVAAVVVATAAATEPCWDHKNGSFWSLFYDIQRQLDIVCYQNNENFDAYSALQIRFDKRTSRKDQVPGRDKTGARHAQSGA